MNNDPFLKKKRKFCFYYFMLLARHTSYNCALPKPKKILCEIERLREKETFLKGVSVERICKNCNRPFPRSPWILSGKIQNSEVECQCGD